MINTSSLHERIMDELNNLFDNSDAYRLHALSL